MTFCGILLDYIENNTCIQRVYVSTKIKHNLVFKQNERGVSFYIVHALKILVHKIQFSLRSTSQSITYRLARMQMLQFWCVSCPLCGHIIFLHNSRRKFCWTGSKLAPIYFSFRQLAYIFCVFFCCLK